MESRARKDEVIIYMYVEEVKLPVPRHEKRILTRGHQKSLNGWLQETNSQPQNKATKATGILHGIQYKQATKVLLNAARIRNRAEANM